MNLSTDAIKENKIMENLKNGVAAVFIVGILGCVTIAVVSIMNGQPVAASMGGAGGLAFTVGAKAITGGKA
jgi:hypothetical protein